MNEQNFTVKAFELLNHFGEWAFQIKNILVMIVFCIPLIISVTFSLSNILHLIGIIFLFIAIFYSLLFRIGSDSTLSFNSNSIIITKNSFNKDISKHEIDIIKITKYSGFHPPVILEIKLKNNISYKFWIDKFNFQNPQLFYNKITKNQDWNEFIIW